jgi:hypothetical protein
VLSEAGMVLEIPVDMLGSDGRRWARLSSQSTAHPSQSHADEEVVGGCNAVWAKKPVLGSIGAAGWPQRKGPCSDRRPKGRAQGSGAGVPNEFLGGVRRMLEGVMFHGPEEQYDFSMRRHRGESTEMGAGDLETVTPETLKPADIALVADKGLGCPRMGGVYQPHPFQHHEGIHGATGRRDVGPTFARTVQSSHTKGYPSRVLGKKSPRVRSR